MGVGTNQTMGNKSKYMKGERSKAEKCRQQRRSEWSKGEQRIADEQPRRESKQRATVMEVLWIRIQLDL
jgi:hypothetical protein